MPHCYKTSHYKTQDDKETCGCEPTQRDKFMISLLSAFIFFLVASPETFKIVRNLVGSWVSSPTGCPTMMGLALHALVFLLVTWGLMNIGK